MRDLDQIRRQFEALTEELIREEYLALSGLKETLEFEQVYTRYPGLVDSETLHVVLQALRAEPASTDRHRERRLLLDSLYTMRIVRDVAPAYEKVVQWRSNREIRLDDGREIPIGRAINEIARTEEQSVRSGIDDARARAVDAELSPLLIEGFRREKANVADLGLTPTYLETFELTKDVSLGKLKDATQAFLRDTSDEWEAVRRELVRERLRMDPATTTRADAFALFRVTDYDTFFPADALERTVFGQVGDLGLDPLAGGRIIVDTAVRKGKYPRAFCAPVRVPDEVYLVTCPTSGAPAEWGVLLHEMGHSLHYAYTDPALPIEYRRLGDMAVTEAYASLFDHLMHDARWLERHTPIGTRAREFVRLQTIEELYNVRRYCARFGYELELYEDNGDFAALPARYEAVMSEATAFRHRREDAFNDVDSRLYVLSYLRARQLRPVLEKALVDRFGRDWWANSSAGAWLVDTLFAQGNRETADEIALRLTGEPLSFAALQRSLLERLY